MCKILLFAVIVLSAFTLLGLEIEVVTETYPPYSYEENGVVGGVATEIVQAVLSELEIDAKISVLRWSRAFRRATRRENVLIYSIARTPERENLFHWIGIVAPFETILYSLSHRHDIIITSIEDLEFWSIGVVKGDTREQFFKSKGLSKVKSYNNSRDLMQALVNGGVDLIPVARLNFPYLVEHLEFREDMFSEKHQLVELGEEGLYMAFGISTDPDIANLFKTAYDRVKNRE